MSGLRRVALVFVDLLLAGGVFWSVSANDALTPPAGGASVDSDRSDGFERLELEPPGPPPPVIRALFDRPVRARPVPAIGSTVQQVPPLRLLGVVDGGAFGVALVGGGVDGSVRRVRVGEFVDGWMLAEIRPKAVELLREGTRRVINLDSPDPDQRQ